MNNLTKSFTIVLALCLLSQLSFAQTYFTDDLSRAAKALSQKATALKDQTSPSASDLLLLGLYFRKFVNGI